MAKDNEITKGGANQVTKGVHVNHEFDTFENVTYSNSTWSVECKVLHIKNHNNAEKKLG